MRLSTFWYCLKQGIINICRHSLLSIASTATISACIFLFCLFFSIIVNIQHMVRSAEENVGITVFFDKGVTMEQMDAIGEAYARRREVKEVRFTSKEEAWEQVKREYFADSPELAEGFAGDNPVADSASYDFFLYNIEDQPKLAEELAATEGVRKVKYSNKVAAGLTSFNRMVGAVSLVIIGILLAVSVFLISNTISVAAAFRRRENQIMRLIGATNFMIRTPFVVEGLMIGLIGAAVPLTVMKLLYQGAVDYVSMKYASLSGIFQFLPESRVFPVMMAVSLTLGVGIGFLGSFFTIRRQLKV